MDAKMREKIKQYLTAKGMPTDIAISFNDVCVIDKKSDIASRSDIRDLRTQIARNTFLNIPLVSANMPDITDARMAVALAHLGGCGFIHQFMSLERRVEEVKKAKRFESSIIENPITISVEQTLGAARDLMRQYQISSLLVLDAKDVLAGILTSRDIKLATDPSEKVKHIMTPMPLVTGLPTTTPEAAQEILRKSKKEKLPLIDAAGKVAGLITAKDILKSRSNTRATRDSKGRLLVGASIGVNKKEIVDEVRALVGAGADIILMDTARAFATIVEDLTKKIKAAFPDVPLIVGNIDRPEAAEMLIKAGADGLKVGIGPGSACKTREETGVGTPQLTAIAECAAVASEYGVPVMADGGIRSGSDLSKALIAGASSVMIGGLFGGAEEAPGEAFYEDGKKWKLFRGSASLEAQALRREEGGLDRIRPTEGVQRRVAYRGEVALIAGDLVGHLRSSMSYVGAHTIPELQELGEFRRQSPAGYMEGKPHKSE